MSANTFGLIKFLNNNNDITIKPNGGLAASYVLNLPTTAPGNNQVLQWNSAGSAFVWADLTAGVTLTSNQPAILAVGGTGTAFTLSFPSQSQRLALMSPESGSGVPSFRAITQNDIPSLDASKITGTLSPSLIPSGTDASSFQLAVGGTGVKIVNSSGTALLVQKNDGSAADIVVNNLTVQGTQTVIKSETLAVDDNTIELNSNLTTGTPTEDFGFIGKRGSSTDAGVLWQESTDRIVAGIVGSMQTLAYKLTRTFTSADLASGILTWAHNQNSRYYTYEIFNSSYQAIGVASQSTDANTITFDLSALTVTGTWYAVITI